MVLDYLLGEMIGVRPVTARHWRAVVATILDSRLTDFEDGTTEQPAETRQRVGACLPTLGDVWEREGVARSVTERCEPLVLDLPALPSQLVPNETTRGAVCVTGAERIGSVPSRCRQGGSVRWGVQIDWVALAQVVGVAAVERVRSLRCSNYRKLDILAGIVCRDRRKSFDRIGFGGCCDDTVAKAQSLASPDDYDATIARLAMRAEDDHSDREALQAAAFDLAESLKAGFGLCLQAGLTEEQSAYQLGVTSRTIQNYKATIRNQLSGFLAKVGS